MDEGLSLLNSRAPLAGFGELMRILERQYGVRTDRPAVNRDENRPVAEIRFRLAAGAFKQFGQVRGIMDDPHSFASSSCRSFDHDRQRDLGSPFQ